MKKFRSDTAIQELAKGFITRQLPKSQWTHDAHWASALYIIEMRQDLCAEDHMPDLIRAYNVSVVGANSDREGYHETITQSSLIMARVFLRDHDSAPLYEICNNLLASPLGKPNWLFEYYSKDLLFSVQARRVWVDPDRKPFPKRSA